MLKQIKDLFKSKQYLAEEARYVNDVKLIKFEVEQAKLCDKSLKSQELSLPFKENVFYPAIGEVLAIDSYIPRQLSQYIKALPPVKQIIDSTEEVGRWKVRGSWEVKEGFLVARDKKLKKTFSFYIRRGFDHVSNGAYCYYTDKYKIFTPEEAELLCKVFVNLKEKSDAKSLKDKRQKLVELYNE